MDPSPPRLLVVDDVLGRRLPKGANQERANVCANFLLQDVTNDQQGSRTFVIRRPLAEAVFVKGQQPVCAEVGDTVDNDLSNVLDIVQQGWKKEAVKPWSLVLLDLSFYTGLVTPESNAKLSGMPDGREEDKNPSGYFGLRILERLHSEFPDLPVVIFSSRSRSEVALQFAKTGALGFIESDAEDGAKVLADIIQRHALVPDSHGIIVGRSRSIAKALRSARRCALNNQNLLIRGESGTGKELIAAYVNRLRRQEGQDRPFRIVNSGALTGDLYYSELFGHCKGAFTDAKSKRVGVIEQANGGDLFLDEIANMPATVQNGLLRVLEEGAVMPLGGSAPDARQVQVRFISATHTNLELMIAEGTFREDLYERLHRGGVIFVPPLRERSDDMGVLMEHFVRGAEKEIGARRRTITNEAIIRCQRYNWPRNIRQLQNCLYQTVSTYPDLEYLLAEHISLPSQVNLALDDSKEEGKERVGLAPILRALREFDFEQLSDQELHGRLEELEASCGDFLARYLRAGLARHRRPGDRIFMQPALQFITGNNKLSTTAAYDIVKRIVKRLNLQMTKLADDDLFVQALEKSRAGRAQKKASPPAKMTSSGQDE